MGQRVQQFNAGHLFDSAGYAAAKAGLEVQLGLGATAAARQREGFIDKHAGGTRKAELVRTVRTVHLPHLARAGRSAAREDHNLAQTFTQRPRSATYAAWRTATGGMVEAAQASKDMLAKYGMEQSVLDDLVKLLAEFDAATEQCNAGRASHVAASAELKAAANEVVRLVGIMDGVNHVRFRDDPALLAAWRSVSRVRKDTPTPAADQGEPSGTPAPGSGGQDQW